MSLLSSTAQQIRDTALRFCSSELTSHASNIIGFSIILFAYFEVVGQFFERRVPFKLCDVPLTWDSLRYFIVFLILSSIIAVIFFAGMRLVYYGKLAHEVIYHKGNVTSLDAFFDTVSTKIHEKKFLGIVPCRWYSSGASEGSVGFWVSFPVGLLISLILMWTFLFY